MFFYDPMMSILFPMPKFPLSQACLRLICDPWVQSLGFRGEGLRVSYARAIRGSGCADSLKNLEEHSGYLWVDSGF